jgi:hypothetical protein
MVSGEICVPDDVPVVVSDPVVPAVGSNVEAAEVLVPLALEDPCVPDILDVSVC